MSLILEALKKSEARRQLGEAPGLGTPFTVARRRRSPLPVILILIVAAGAFGWYYLGSGPTPAPGTASKAAPAADAKGSTAAPGKPAADSIMTSRQNATSAAQRPGIATPPRGAAQNAVATNPDSLRASHSPLEAKPNVVAPGFAVPRPDAAPPPKPTVVASGTGTPKSEPQPAPAAGAAGAKPAMATATPPPMATAVPQPAPAPAQPDTASATPPPAQPATPPPPPVPMYYELPFNVRKDLPPMNVSMHVYSANPAQRFVMFDGERKGEGDSLKDGLTVREIRNDGIVLEFRGQQFFYPRPGR